MLHVVWVWPMEPLPGKRPKDPHSSPEFQTATLPNLLNHYFHLLLSSFCQQSLKQISKHAMWHEAKETTSTWIFSGQHLLRDTTSFFRSKWPMFGQLLPIQKRMNIPYTIDTSRKTHWKILFYTFFLNSWDPGNEDKNDTRWINSIFSIMIQVEKKCCHDSLQHMERRKTFNLSMGSADFGQNLSEKNTGCEERFWIVFGSPSDAKPLHFAGSQLLCTLKHPVPTNMK